MPQLGKKHRDRARLSYLGEAHRLRTKSGPPCTRLTQPQLREETGAIIVNFTSHEILNIRRHRKSWELRLIWHWASSNWKSWYIGTMHRRTLSLTTPPTNTVRGRFLILGGIITLVTLVYMFTPRSIIKNHVTGNYPYVRPSTPQIYTPTPEPPSLKPAPEKLIVKVQLEGEDLNWLLKLLRLPARERAESRQRPHRRRVSRVANHKLQPPPLNTHFHPAQPRQRRRGQGQMATAV
jgi:hypothetical protein